MNETFAAKGGRKEAVWTDLAKKLGLGNHGIGQIFIVVNGQRKENQCNHLVTLEFLLKPATRDVPSNFTKFVPFKGDTMFLFSNSKSV